MSILPGAVHINKQTVRLFLGNQKIFIKIILFEENKKESLQCFLKGERDGLLWRLKK